MANKINTVEKGDAFEDRVFSEIKKRVESGNFGLDSKRSYVYKKKSYQTRGGRNIVFDIVIETYMPNAKEPSILTLIECKDYNSPIPVEKISKFAYDINDVGGHKGIFITTSNFQSGASNVAKAEKIGLAIMDNSNNLDWKLQRIGKRNYQIKQEIEKYITDMESTKKYPFIAILGNSYYHSIIDFLSEVMEQELKSSIEIPFIEPQLIEKYILDLFKEKNRNDLQYFMKTEELIDVVKKQLKIDLNFDDTLDDEIGHCDFQNNRISIINTIGYGSPRWRFTLAHEIGHYILHHYLYEKYDIGMASDDEINFNELSDNLTKRLELQANIFALEILIPDEIFKAVYSQEHRKRNLNNFPILYVDSQQCNIESYYIITENIAQKFGVSREVVHNKLLKLNFLKLDNPAISNCEKENSIGKLAKDYISKSLLLA
jgi:Zn-dependent peptidase ImmA (M78 family)